MQLGLPEENQLIADTFSRFFEAESTPDRVRAAEPVGFDPLLWAALADMGVPGMRAPVHRGGGGFSLFDACLVLERAGRKLAAAPIAEAMSATAMLAALGGEAADAWLAKAVSGKAIVVVTLQSADEAPVQLVPGGAVADAILVFDGGAFVLLEPDAREMPPSLGGSALARIDVRVGKRTPLDSNNALAIWQAGMEEYKLLLASLLIGLSLEALDMAAAYAAERTQFGVPIGTHQGISHVLANDVIDADGGQLLIWRTLRSLADGTADAGAGCAASFWWAARTATNAVAHALHTFGGYGLTNEYDIQLYHRRAKAWALPMGDPTEQLLLAGRRLFRGDRPAVPEPGFVPIDVEVPEHARPIADETRASFERLLTPELRAKAHHSFEGHDWGLSRALGAEKLLYPDWPEEWGGRGLDGACARASSDVWGEFGWTITPRSVSGMIGKLIMMFGSEQVKHEVLPRLASGEILASLGYSEPSCGSDVFAARTRAVRDGDDWVINGQKMFTSGANIASYVFLLTRTDPDVPKHAGLTMFLVPIDTPGVEVHPVHTFMDELTNATFYADVRIPDSYRIGPVNGGVKVMAAALEMEQSGGGYYAQQRLMIAEILKWADGKSRYGLPMLDDADFLRRLARVSTHADVAEMLAHRVVDGRARGNDLAYGQACKVFSTETFISDSADLLDLTAPDSVLRGRTGLGLIEDGYRHSTATSIYGGTSEICRSLVAERRLGLPRSRAKQ